MPANTLISAYCGFGSKGCMLLRASRLRERCGTVWYAWVHACIVTSGMQHAFSWFFSLEPLDKFLGTHLTGTIYLWSLVPQAARRKQLTRTLTAFGFVMTFRCCSPSCARKLYSRGTQCINKYLITTLRAHVLLKSSLCQRKILHAKPRVTAIAPRAELQNFHESRTVLDFKCPYKQALVFWYK